jgi:predicted outer membrane protein
VRSPVPRFVRWAVALAVIAALTVTVFQYWGMSQYGTPSVHNTGPNTGWRQTQWGPLGPADRDLLVMIQQAGWYGGLSGQRAQQQGSSAALRAIAKRIGVDYGTLDTQVRSIAAKLSVPLPEHPTAQQQDWMRELSGRSGPDFDRMFAQRLRRTDGEVLPVITSVRAGTRNELIRSFATNAAALLNRHMEYLESTGLVDYSRLPEPLPPAAMSPSAGQGQHIGQVVHATPASLTVSPADPPAGNDVNAMVAALILIAALLVALGLLGTAGRRVRRAGVQPPRRGGLHHSSPRRSLHRQHAAQRQSRHAAQRW